MYQPMFRHHLLAPFHVELTSPQGTVHFVRTGASVIGSGTTATGHVDYFYGQDGVAYAVTIAPGANLFNTFDNVASSNHNGLYGTPFLTSAGLPNHEVLYLTAGTFVNRGTLNTYPLHFGVAANNYHQTSAVVYINNTKTTPSQVTNFGTIGDADYISNRSDSRFSYSQENTAGLVLNDGTITNAASGVITGYNAVFTFGQGIINNYGRLSAVNDAALTGFVLNNYASASVSTTVAGFACAHAYNTVNNWGYMLGNDYGILLTGKHLAINDYGGPAIAGVKNFNGTPVYNGEISALMRGSEMPNTQGPFQNYDAIMLAGSDLTVNLSSQTINGTVYLPVIVGPMEGGFNGHYGAPAANDHNTLNFALSGISAAQAQGFQTAIAHSVKDGPHGQYYSGAYTLNGITYQWEDFATVTFSGKVVAAPTPTAHPTSTATSGSHSTMNNTPGATTTMAPAQATPAGALFPMLLGLLLVLLTLSAGIALLIRRARTGPRQASLVAESHSKVQGRDDTAPYRSALQEAWDREDHEW